MPPITPRLLLRPWREADKAPFARMNANPEVRRYFPGLLTEAESNAAVDRYQADDSEHGYTFWAAELRSTGEFIGFVGLHPPNPAYNFPPGAPELGWRLDQPFWGRGYATEAALACRDFAFNELSAPAVGAVTTVTNEPSMNVMHKLGMKHVSNFMHPEIDPVDPIAPHVLYMLDYKNYTKGLRQQSNSGT